MQSVQANTRQMNGVVVSFFERWKVHIRKEKQGRRASHGGEAGVEIFEGDTEEDSVRDTEEDCFTDALLMLYTGGLLY
jgi:hypothetical protein